MGRPHLLFGRNVFEEALRVNAEILEVYFQNLPAKNFVEGLLRDHRKSLKIIRDGIPKELSEQSHQGVAFRVNFDFRVSDGEVGEAKHPRILLLNHIEDVQNFGAIVRSAAAFGFTLIAHESKRSATLTAAAIKTSAGMAFRSRFLEVSNLGYFAKGLQKDGYQIAVLESDDRSVSLYDWEPMAPLALVLGSEGEGVSRTLVELADICLKIPMSPGVDSLNVAQAASVGLSWIHAKL